MKYPLDPIDDKQTAVTLVRYYQCPVLLTGTGVHEVGQFPVPKAEFFAATHPQLQMGIKRHNGVLL